MWPFWTLYSVQLYMHRSCVFSLVLQKVDCLSLQYIRLVIVFVLVKSPCLCWDLFLLLSQAPESMKSVVQAGWLLTTAVGNMFDVIIASVRIPSQVCHFFNWFSRIHCSSIVRRWMCSHISSLMHYIYFRTVAHTRLYISSALPENIQIQTSTADLTMHLNDFNLRMHCETSVSCTC